MKAKDGAGSVYKNGYRVHTKRYKRHYEHRRVMEEYLGRPLRPNESIHHIDGNKLNNKLENLALLPFGHHMKLHALENGLGKDRSGISPTNKTPKTIIAAIKKDRAKGIYLKDLQTKYGLSYPTIQKYAKEAR